MTRSCRRRCPGVTLAAPLLAVTELALTTGVTDAMSGAALWSCSAVTSFASCR